MTSAAEPTSGVWPPMLPPACSVIVLTPFSVTRWSTLLLPCTVMLWPTSWMAPPPTSLPPPWCPGSSAPGRVVARGRQRIDVLQS